LAGAYGATASSYSATPGMIGDFFGGGYKMILPSLSNSGSPTLATNVPIAAADRRFKIAENNSPFPADRVFFNYHHFNNAIRDVDGRLFSLDRYLFGIEKTFLDGLWSIEGRVPFASGLRAEQFVGAGVDNEATEFGNMSLVLKRLLYDGCCWRFSGGLGIVFPTGPEAEIYDQSGALALVLENEAVYFQPFLGALYTPNDRLWVQTFAQVDFDSGGNAVDWITIDEPNGVIQDQSLLFLDVAIGYWIYRSCCCDSWITGIAPMVELHYSTTMQNTDFVGGTSGNFITNPDNRLDVLNLTGGLRFQLRELSFLTIAGVAPLRQGSDKIFDSEVSLQYVRVF
jgi:hypothetical protein